MDRRLVSAALAALLLVVAGCVTNPPGKTPEPHAASESVDVEQLPLPPTATTVGAGGCTPEVNPNNTGCISRGRDGILGTRSFTWDSRHVLVGVTFAGASEGSVFRGAQLILVKTDGEVFPNGDGWRCLTCGVPPVNKVGMNDPTDVSYPEAFRDGKRVKFGRNVLDCAPVDIVDCDAAADTTHIYPITSPFPTPGGGQMRELRLHPDNLHLGWNEMFLSPDRRDATQFGVFGRMAFNPKANPPDYELSNMSWLVSDDPQTSGRFVSVKEPPRGGSPAVLQLDEGAGVIGEFRGFTSDGASFLGIGAQDSWNWDIFATSLESGKSDRLSRDPAYTDPVSMSPDDRSLVIADGRVNNQTGLPGANADGTDGRMYFAGALPGVPPLIDLAISSAIGNLYNDQYGSGSRVAVDDHTGGRRFFQPYLINRDADRRGIHDGRQLNAGADDTPGSGSISDPLWNAGADPAWSPDGTAIVYYQLLVGSPACDDAPQEPAPCPTSKEPGGRMSRLMIARLTDRIPTAPRPLADPVPDAVHWGIRYQAGDALPPRRQQVPAGRYTLRGKAGSATVAIAHGPSTFPGQATEVVGVEVTYDNYSSDGSNILNGKESGVRDSDPARYTWHSDITLSGENTGSRKTSEPEGFVVQSPGLAQPPTITGRLTTVLNGMTFTSPVTGS